MVSPHFTGGARRLHHDYNPRRDSIIGGHRGVADVAAQPQLGLLSEQRSRTGCRNPRDSITARAYLSKYIAPKSGYWLLAVVK